MWQTTQITDSYRAASQDRCLLLPRPNGVLLAIADGVGGRAGGGEAAQLAVELVQTLSPNIPSGNAARWAALIAYIDGEITADDAAGQTTLVLVEARERKIVGASVGDSRALFFANDGGIHDLTQHQQRKPFLGCGGSIPLSFSLNVPKDGGTIVAASDGLFDYADSERIYRAAQEADLEAAAKQLALAARGEGSNHLYDDLAIVLARWMP